MKPNRVFTLFASCLTLALCALSALPAATADTAASCPDGRRTVVANVVAIDQPLMLNRLGANIPGGMIFALARDVVNAKGESCYPNPGTTCDPTKTTVSLRRDKRPRPLTMRANEGDCLLINFTNLLTPVPGSFPLTAPSATERLVQQAEQKVGRGARLKALEERVQKGAAAAQQAAPSAQAAAADIPKMSQPATRAASLHVQGMSWVRGPQDDGSFVGKNASSLVAPGASTQYMLFADHEGTYLLYSTADDWTPISTNQPKVTLGDGGTLAEGLFGAVNVQPTGSRVIDEFRKRLAAKPPRKALVAQVQALSAQLAPIVTEWYRSQVTQQDLCLASRDGKYDPASGRCSRQNPSALPVVDYQAIYPDDATHFPLTKNLPILNMLCTGKAVERGACTRDELVHTDLTAIVTGPNAGAFPASPDPNFQPPALRAIYSLPDRLQPYREFTVIYHESFAVQQAFGALYADGNLSSLTSAADNFGINYGMGGIVSEIIANRLGVGPMATCTDCKYEEFFLSAWSVGDPAMNVNVPATNCVGLDSKAKPGCKATEAFYPDDPSNVYPSYMADHVRFRILHAGPDLHHLHHQHAHQWLHSPNTPNGDYTDSQSIGPGSAFTLEMVYNGSGNVNQTVGDSIFHCHFYAHFASGMWGLWRVHDVLEAGTLLGPDGRPADLQNPQTGKLELTRALPDGEIAAGTPIPAIVPVPTLPMPPMPAPVRLVDDGKKAEVQLVEKLGDSGTWQDPLKAGSIAGKQYLNPGFPFFIPGIAGSRAPHPPLDFAYSCSDNGASCTPDGGPIAKDLAACRDPRTALCQPLDGGLPRHVVKDGTADIPPLNNTDFSKVLHTLDAYNLDEQGTLVEKIAMQTHAQRMHPTCLPNGKCTGACSDNSAPCTVGNVSQCGTPAATCDPNKQVTFVLNGLGAKPGAPYADPCIRFDRNGGPADDMLMRRYLAADVQLDTVFNKSGFHFPQARMISLWGDVQATIDGQRPPQPLFFRANTNDCIEYTLANLVPNVYELDDFQVRTPTDIIGQHIHLVKFDVTSSDGATNGWNYEDGTFAPNEVTERIRAINATNGLIDPNNEQRMPKLEAKPIKFFGPGPGGAWMGAQATVQRWYSDPLYNNAGFCSDNLADCTLLDRSLCGDSKTAVCESSAGFCSNKPTVRCTAANRLPCADVNVNVHAECDTIHDRTLRTVFTHDHFGPSTHQQAGLYAGLVVEPKGSEWLDNETGKQFGGFVPTTGKNFPSRPASQNGVTVLDGGPTTWEAVIRTPSSSRSFREFLLEMQDTMLAYQPWSVPAFKADVTTVDGKAQFQGGDNQICAANPGEPCGFCPFNGVCVVTATGLPASPFQTCQLDSPSGGNPGACTATGSACSLRVGNLVACTPEHFSACLGLPPSGGGADPANFSKPVQSCNFVTGIPATSWATTPVDAQFFSPSSFPEIITFFAASHNFSVNYRDEPIFTRTTNPATGKPLAGTAGDMAYAFSSTIDRPNPRGQLCGGTLTACSSTAPACASGTCEWVGFCSDNFARCTPSNRSLCRTTAATCQGAVATSTAAPYTPLTADVQKNDPFTPLLRAYAGDDLKVRILTGAHINPHNFTFEGLSWLMEPSFVDSGWRSSQTMGISEHFEFVTKVPAAFATAKPGTASDFLYQPGAAANEQDSGNWGLMRAYSTRNANLFPLPQNPPPASDGGKVPVCPAVQPAGTTVRQYDVVALTAQQALGNPLNYNDRLDPATLGIPAMLFLDKRDLTCGADPSTCKLKAGIKPSPLVLRAAAGDCIKVTLENGLSTSGFCSLNTGQPCSKTSPCGAGDGVCQGYGTCAQVKAKSPAGSFTLLSPLTACTPANVTSVCKTTATNVTRLCAPFVVPGVTSQQQTNLESNTSQVVGLRPQLVTFDVQTSGGTNAGFNPVQTAAPGGKVTYTWYAGHVDPKGGTHIPIEFGGANLLPPDVFNHYRNSLFGGLIIEPAGWSEPSPTGSTVSYTVKYKDREGKDKSFQEFAVFTLDDQIIAENNPTDAVNFGSEPLFPFNSYVDQPNNRFCTKEACEASINTGFQDVSCQLASSPTGGQQLWFSDFKAKTCTQHDFSPATPIYEACAGDQVRFRMLHPGGDITNNVIEVYGHNWSEASYMTQYDHCEAPTTHTNLYASQIMGDKNLCASRDFKVGKLSARDLDTEKEANPFWDASLNSWQGAHNGHGPTNHFEILIESAGGPLKRPGDYLYRSFPADHFNLGMWGIFRVRQCASADSAATTPPAGGERAGGDR